MITPECFLICMVACFIAAGLSFLYGGISDAGSHGDYGFAYEDIVKVAKGLGLLAVAFLMVVL
jgi:hypothetical protein